MQSFPHFRKLSWNALGKGILIRSILFLIFTGTYFCNGISDIRNPIASLCMTICGMEDSFGAPVFGENCVGNLFHYNCCCRDVR